MAWKETLLDASFRGVRFDCLRTQDSATRDTAQHEYPYLDGADVEDLGRKARQVTISAIFFGKDYEKRLQAFINILDQDGAGELIHPVFGSIQEAQLLSYEISHDADNPDACMLNLSFVEATPGNPFFVRELPEQQAEMVALLAQFSCQQGLDILNRVLEGINSAKAGLNRLNGLRDVMLGTLAGIRGQVQGIIQGTLDLINYPRAFASEVLGQLKGMVDLRPFDRNKILADWKALASQVRQIILLPGDVAAGKPGAGSSTQPGTGGSGNAKPGQGNTSLSPQAVAEDVAIIHAIVQLVAVTTLAEVASDILAEEVQQPTLSPGEIEQICQEVRTLLQDAIDTQRSLFPLETARPVTEALKDTALAVQQAALAVMETRPPLTQYTLAAPGNLHLIAFQHYGDYRRANELLRLNPQIRHPNQLQTGDTLYVYAR